MARSKDLPFPVVLDRSSETPLTIQLYRALREDILSKRLRPGTRMPSTRELASQLGVSRNTVIVSFEQLFSEEFIEGKIGSGTYVTDKLPEELLGSAPNRRSANSKPQLSDGVKSLLTTLTSPSRDIGEHKPFRPSIVALDEFPIQTWNRLRAKVCRNRIIPLLNYGTASGYRPLRRTIAKYLGHMRGVVCEPEQVIITNGSSAGLDLIARVLSNPGQSVAVEDPGYVAARELFIAQGVKVIPIPVDNEGIKVRDFPKNAPKLCFVTPSFQYPLGISMSLPRRMELLDWATKNNSWIIEDDYDAEYRYSGRMLTALQGLDRTGRVIYLGTLSKSLYPSLRLGYVVVPPNLVDTFERAKTVWGGHCSSIEQATLSEFIEEGYFSQHMRKMRELYFERQQDLIYVIKNTLGELISVAPKENGMHLIGVLKQGIKDYELSNKAKQDGVVLFPVSGFSMLKLGYSAVMLGYTSFNRKQMEASAKVLRKILEHR